MIPTDVAGVRFLIAGRVQGVGFRAATQAQAEALGIAGQAINLDDGRVEVIACGPPDAIEQLATWLRQGPPGARVDRLERQATDAPATTDFRVG